MVSLFASPLMYSTHPGEHVEQLRKEMDILASTLPEYTTVMGIYGAGKTYGPQLIAEIGNVSRFTHRGALTAFAGVDPGVDQSGQHNSKSNRASKVGSARLRKTLFQVMTTLLFISRLLINFYSHKAACLHTNVLEVESF